MAHKRIVLDNDNPLRSLRAAIGLTQEQASEKCGVKRSALSEAERRGGGVTVATLGEYLLRYGRRLQVVAIDEGEASDEK